MKKSNFALLNSMYLLAAMDAARSNNYITSCEKPNKIALRKPKPETESERAKRLGLKEWNIDGKVVYAATKKKALRIVKEKENGI